MEVGWGRGVVTECDSTVEADPGWGGVGNNKEEAILRAQAN